ncbi:hypothetical protein D3OALGA1CA_1705 [Olavius algarvensis associated proteobacterium Delta 3]|nr:hypothetical protein D3OALGA1CA_1705 [Olavius algarvensis associated proteobacterium Delta 3]CAB5161056.1 hypothetical protein D3OALGB2SA_5432 [Olavius algarvensis associated proteobacterium Delta 3]
MFVSAEYLIPSTEYPSRIPLAGLPVGPVCRLGQDTSFKIQDT